MNDYAELNRRAFLGRAMLLAGASLTVGACDLFSGPQGATRLSQKQLVLLSAIADTIVPDTGTPGAIKAGVPKAFDGLFTDWASPERREDLAGAMAAIDKLGGGAGFAALSSDRRTKLLTEHDAAALQPDPGGKPDSGVFAAGPPSANPAYAKLKELIVVLFYMSESALTHDLEYEHVPGKWAPSVPITPDTRTQGGSSLF